MHFIRCIGDCNRHLLQAKEYSKKDWKTPDGEQLLEEINLTLVRFEQLKEQFHVRPTSFE